MKRIFISIILLLVLLGGIGIWTTYKKVYMPNVITNNQSGVLIDIPTNSNFEDLKRIIAEKGVVSNIQWFEWVAEQKDFIDDIKPGRYKLTNGMSNNELINLLRSGIQTPVKLKFNNIRTLSQLAGIVGMQIEPDSAEIIKLLSDPDYVAQIGFNLNTVSCIFIPNTYEVYWTITAQGFIERMKIEFDRFWNDERVEKANQLGLTKTQIITLASIVDEESNINSEYPVIAGLYLNRIRKGMPLQADPTIKFAIGNFAIKRVLSNHLKVESPYNTYRNIGIPPGPITIPSIKAIDAVLSPQKHSYLYMCAKSDFSGRHAFAKTLSQHNQNAIAYQKALNLRKIYR